MATGILQVISEGDLQAAEEAARNTPEEEQDIRHATNNLAGYIRGVFYDFRNARIQESIDGRINNALLVYNGQYTPSKLAQIRQFGGSEVYSRLTTVKCRGTTAMLREVFLGSEQPWGLKPTPVPELPPEAEVNVNQLIIEELMQLNAQGLPMPSPRLVNERQRQLLEEAQKQMNQRVAEATSRAEKAIQDILVEGRFYEALNEFLIDLPIYPFAVLKGPVVQMEASLKWNSDGSMNVVDEPKMSWYRVDPMNIYFTPGVSRVEDCTFIERIKLSRADLNALLGVAGYDDTVIRQVLGEYSTGLRDWIDQYDYQYAEEQAKEDPNRNVSELLDALEYHGPIKGDLLLKHGFSEDVITDATLDYYVDAWIVGHHVLKVQLNPNPNKRPIYYMSSFEKVPGAVIGHGLPEIICDIQDVANAALRSLVNNMSIASGPQIGVNEELLTAASDADNLYPWKRWRFNTDPMSNNNGQLPITFFQPRSNAQELLGIYQQMTQIADEISAIPRYLTGSQNVTGAASTASGLSMLMNNAAKVLQNIAANIDHDVFKPVLTMLYDIIMLTDNTNMLRGDEEVVVMGVGVAAKRETDRMRQLEFLQMTGNPIDMQIIGESGRAAVLRQLADNLGLEGEQIVPSDEQIRQQMEQARMAAAAANAEAQRLGEGGSRNQPSPPPGAGRGPEETVDNMQRTRNM